MHIKGIQHAFAHFPVQQRRSHLIKPGKPEQNGNDDNSHQWIIEQTLHTVTDHDRNLTPAGDNQHRHSQEQQHHCMEGRPSHTEKIKMMREITVINNKTCRNSRKNRIIDNPGRTLQDGSKDAKFAAVAHLEELPHGHRPGFPEAVDTVTGQSEEEPDRGANAVPELECESAVVIHFKNSHQADQSHSGFTAGNRNNITPGNPPGSQKIRNPGNITLRFPANEKNNQKRQCNNDPINPMHQKKNSFVCS